MTVLCPVCKKGRGFPFFRCEEAPVLNNILCKTPEDAKNVPVGKLDFWACEYCGFIWNAAFDEKLVRYDASYENNQSHSPVFTRHLQEVVARVRSLMGHRPFSVLEAGCGQGYFLEMLQENPDSEIVRGVGFDPALRSQRRLGNTDFIPEFASAKRLPDDMVSPLLLLSRHVIEHISDPLSFLRSLLALSPEISAVMLETPCVEWIVKNNAYFDLYYEHCSVFTPAALSVLLSETGLYDIEIARLFGGQYLSGTASTQGKTRMGLAGQRSYRELYNDFMPDYQYFSECWKNRLRKFKNQGKRVALWGGGSKGVMFAALLSAEEGILSVVDINPQKQGCYLPLSALPVVSPEEAKSAGVDVIIIMNPNYAEEIKTLCARMDFSPRWVPLS